MGFSMKSTIHWKPKIYQPSNHPFLDWDFPWNQPFFHDFWGYPPGNPHWISGIPHGLDQQNTVDRFASWIGTDDPRASHGSCSEPRRRGWAAQGWRSPWKEWGDVWIVYINANMYIYIYTYMHILHISCIYIYWYDIIYLIMYHISTHCVCINIYIYTHKDTGYFHHGIFMGRFHGMYDQHQDDVESTVGIGEETNHD